MKLPNHVEIRQDEKYTKVILNDKEVHGVRSIEFRQSIDTIPIVTLELVSTADIDLELEEDGLEVSADYYDTDTCVHGA